MVHTTENELPDLKIGDVLIEEYSILYRPEGMQRNWGRSQNIITINRVTSQTAFGQNALGTQYKFKLKMGFRLWKNFGPIPIGEKGTFHILTPEIKQEIQKAQEIAELKESADDFFKWYAQNRKAIPLEKQKELMHLAKCFKSQLGY